VNRILVIRGGAIGDFILTLPTIGALRDRWPRAHVEIVGHKSIIALAEQRFYADGTRSIEDGLLASFFSPDAVLPGEWTRYFAGFDLVLSYLYDPDAIFATNLQRAGVMRLVQGPAKIVGPEHAAAQLAKPLAALGIPAPDPAPRFYPSAADIASAKRFLDSDRRPRLMLHPGSGSVEKTWPVGRWKDLVGQFCDAASVTLIGGEADRAASAALRVEFRDVQVAEDLPLPLLGAVLAASDLFIGHDSGISHLAAAAGATCLLLFGPTDPAIWAPANKNAQILRAPADGGMASLRVDDVVRAAQELMRIGIST